MSEINAYNILSEDEQDYVLQAIEHAEKSTSGEIRVHIQNTCKEDVMDHAAFIFRELEMHKTKLRNGVLIYLSVQDQKLAILGDAGINKSVGANFWQETFNELQKNLSSGNAQNGLCAAIEQIGILLSTHFPYQENDKNELTNEISFSKE